MVCEDNLDYHDTQDILDCWEKISNTLCFREDLVIRQITTWLAGPTAKVLDGDRANDELAKTFIGPKKTKEELLEIINKARSKL